MFSRPASSGPSGGGREGRALYLLVGLLLALHAAWICFHLTLVAKERINPWKLGGYGMYTGPNLKARSHVLVLNEEEQRWKELESSAVNKYRLDSLNHRYVFRCRAPSEESIVALFEENPQLRNRPLTIALSEWQFSRDPIGAKRELYAWIQVAWESPTEFVFGGMLCSERFNGGSVTLPEP